MAKRGPSVPDLRDRMARLGFRMARGEAITTAYIRRTFGVSKATAKRDAAALDRALRGSAPLSRGAQPARRVSMGEHRSILLLSAGDD